MCRGLLMTGTADDRSAPSPLRPLTLQHVPQFNLWQVNFRGRREETLTLSPLCPIGTNRSTKGLPERKKDSFIKCLLCAGPCAKH